MKIELVGPLKKTAGLNELRLKINEKTRLSEALNMLPEQIKKRILDPRGNILPEIIVLVNGVEVKSLGLENTYVKDEDEITIIPIIHGG